MNVEIVPATLAHAEAIAADARQADVDELWAQARATPLSALRVGLRSTSRARTGLVDGVPVCLFGVSPFSILSGQGTPWMVGSNGLKPLRVQKALLIHSRLEFAAMRANYSVLFNAVDDRNTSAKRWLTWLGFTLLGPMIYGPDRLPFRPFYWSA